MVQGTIFMEQTGRWMKGSRDMAALKGKFVNESPAYVFRDRSLALPEKGSPAALEVERGSLVTGFLLGLVASYIYSKGKRRKR